MTATYLTFVDTETTGLDENLHDLIEIAAVKTVIETSSTVELRRITVLETMCEKIKPNLPVDPVVKKINNYKESDWENAISLPEALEKVFELMQNSWHCGSNPAFDQRFLKKAASDLHWTYPRLANYHLVDISTFAFPLLFQGKIAKIGQDTISRYYELGACEHSALADAMQCMKIFATINQLEIINK